MKLLDDSPIGQKELQQAYSDKINSKKRQTFWIAMVMIVFGLLAMALSSCKDDPDSEGTHWNYSVACEGGFKYKVLSYKVGIVQMLNSDGTPLECDKERY